MTIEERSIHTSRGPVTVVTLCNSAGMTVELSSLGAGIVSVVVPDREGNLADVALGYAEMESYWCDGPCAGKIPGRYANRIAKGRFSIDGKEYELAVNNGPNALHGGPTGFQNRLWQTRLLPNGVEFTYTSADGEEGYPGNLTVKASYTLDENDNTIHLDLIAHTDAPTVVNLTNHTYWNLDGHSSGSVLEHVMQMKCDRYLPTEETLIPTGEFAPVEGTPMDFRQDKPLGQEIGKEFPALKYAKGYDASWVVNGWEPGKAVNEAVVIYSPHSGRRLAISSDQPAAHVYTGNWLTGSPLGKDGYEYKDYDAVAVEMQGMPDAPNHAHFPSQSLRPGEVYHRQIDFAFSCK